LNPYDADLEFDETQPQRRVAHLQRGTASEVPAASIHPKGIGVLHSDLRHLTRPPSVNRTANLEIDTPDQQYLRRILRLIQKWLNAGVIEEGQWSDTKTGSPQGSVISPLLANIYLHYVFDLWVNVWRTKWAQGEVVVVR
jgi:hypothetical protein